MAQPVPTVRIGGLTVLAAGRPLARVADLDLWPTQVLHLTGPNGVGKTTLLRVMAGERPGAAGVEVLGHPPGSLAARAATAWVPTDALLPDDLTGAEYLQFTAALWSRPLTPLLQLAHALGLQRWLDAWPDELSRGTRHKVALSAALGLNLPLTLLDEPFGTLDSGSRTTLLRAIAQRARDGGALIVTTHGAELESLAPHTVALEPA